jgi:hypothetical protein
VDGGGDDGAPRLALALSWLLPAALFWSSAAPDVCLVDAGALCLAAAGPGVAHPPGFPAWVLLGRCGPDGLTLHVVGANMLMLMLMRAAPPLSAAGPSHCHRHPL